MKYTLFVTERCNLACSYCYVGKTDRRMGIGIARTIVDFAFEHTPREEDVDIGFFGGEPLLEFPLIRQVTSYIEAHPQYDPCRVKLSVVTNGTLMTPEIAQFIKEHRFSVTVSFDGMPELHDLYRRYPNGTGSSRQTMEGIRTVLDVVGRAPVNIVYGPSTFDRLPEAIDFVSGLGVRQIYINPDLSARWTEEQVNRIPEVYAAVADRYLRFYREGRPHFISLIDGKITVILRRGYQPLERCRMGTGEFAFTASGRVLPCERLAASDVRLHAMGTVDGLVHIGPLPSHLQPGAPVNTPCLSCGLQPYCVNWCGCSNYFMTGSYNRVGPVLCASERAAIALAYHIMQTLESELGPTFMDHLGGLGLSGSFWSEERQHACEAHA